MFDLEKAIADWRRQMLAADIKTPVPLEELEAHLRDEIERQMKSAMNEQTAFEIAAGRIGQAGLLKMEFKKNDGVDKVQQRRRAGFCFAVILGLYSLVISYQLLKNDLTFHGRLLGFASVAVLLLSLFAVWRIPPHFLPVITSRAARSAIGIVGGSSGMGWMIAFAWLILPRCDFTQGQILVAFLWAVVPMMILPATAFMVIDKSENQPSATTCS